MTDAVNNIFLDAVPSLPDSRDYKYTQRQSGLKESVDLREWASDVEDQLSVGSCVGQAITSAYELTVRKLYPDRFVNLSSLFLYYNSRLFDNSIKDDIGTYIRDGLKAAARYGICSETLWPYVEDKFNQQPSPEAYVDASQRLVTKYETLYTLRDMLEVLNDNKPIVVGITIYQDFMLMNTTQPVVKLPRANEIPAGNHAVVILGYDLSNQLFLAKNSFGSNWGIQGYFWMPFEYARTQMFEKWSFDISSQKLIDIDEPVVGNKSISNGRLMVEIGPNGVALKQVSQEKKRGSYKSA
jgi:C1A family cysteine protease